MRVYIFGAGKVGTALARGLRRAKASVTLRAARRGWPRRLDADLVVLAVRDDAIAGAVRALGDVALAARAAVVHCAGAMDGTVLAPLGVDRVGQMHPLVSFASRRTSPPLEGATMRLAGAARAKTLGRRVALLLRMRPRELDGLDPTLYHAAAALCANGAAALVAASARLLQVGGVPSDEAIALLAPLLSSVAHNVEALGLPEALTGPVRRGDTIAVAAHLRLVTRHAPELIPLLEALIAAQLPMARALGEAPVENFDAIAVTLAR